MKLVILNTHPIQYFAPLYKRLAQEKNIKLTVLYCSRWGLEEYDDPQFKSKFKWDIPLLDGYNYKFLKNVRNTEDVSKFFNLINLEVISEILKNKYDILWINGHNNFTNIMAVAISKLIGTKLFMRADTQLGTERGLIKKLLRKPVMNLFYRLFSGFLLIGTRNKEYYNYIGVPEHKLFFVPFSVDNKNFIERITIARTKKNEILQKFKLPYLSLNILFASKLIRRKNPLDLLKAFELIKKKLSNVSLIFVGTGEEERNLKDYIELNKIPNVYFLGFLNQTEIPEAFSLSDVFVLPAVNEPWGLVINEAMCAGIPIVAADVIGAAPDLIKNGINGYTFKPGNINELAGKLETILINKELRIAMGKKSLEIINSWSFNECIEGINKAVESIVN